MDVTVEGGGPSAVREITELCDWINRARLPAVKSVAQDKQPPRPGEQGPELLQILQVVLAAPAVIALIGCISEHIRASRPTMKITIKTKKGTLIIDAKNPPSSDDLERMAKSLQPD